MNEEIAIRALITDRVEAMRAGDAETLCGSYTADALVFNLAPPLAQPSGRACDVGQMQAWFKEKGGAVWSEIRDLQITVSGDLAVATSLAAMGAPPKSPQPFALWYRSTLALHKRANRWLIFHEHSSTPFHMDGSMRAATDLVP